MEDGVVLRHTKTIPPPPLLLEDDMSDERERPAVVMLWLIIFCGCLTLAAVVYSTTR